MAGGGERRRYAAFISYSHSDEALAAWLHKALEAYRTPAALRGKPGAYGPVPKQVGKCFRDRAELAASDDLGREIREALDQSDALIVLCSPKSAGSKYVEEEIRYFKSLGRGRRILAAIAGGEPHAAGKVIAGRTLTEADECFPRALLRAVDAQGQIGEAPETHEFIAADFREGKDERDAGKLKLLAGLLGVGLDDLVRRERVAAARRARLFAYAALAFAGLAVAAGVFGFEANRQRGIAEEALNTSEERLQISRAQRIAGEAQSALSIANTIDHAIEARGPRDSEDPLFDFADDEYQRYRAQGAIERATLLSLESLNTAQTEEGELSLRLALSSLWPEATRRVLHSRDVLGWNGDNVLALVTDEGLGDALDLTEGTVTPSAGLATTGTWGQNVDEVGALTSIAGRYRVVGSTENFQAIELTDTQSGATRVLQHEWSNPQAAFSADERYLVTLTPRVSMDAADPTAEALAGSALRVWETATGRLVFHVSMAQGGGLVGSSLSPDGRRLATYTLDGLGRIGISIWTLYPEDARDEACQRLSRNLSQSEWSAYVRDRDYSETCPGLPEPEY